MEAALAGKEVGLVQFMSACFRRSNRRFRKAGMAVVNSYGDCGLWSMIVDVWDVVTFGRGLRRRIRPADERSSHHRDTARLRGIPPTIFGYQPCLLRAHEDGSIVEIHRMLRALDEHRVVHFHANRASLIFAPVRNQILRPVHAGEVLDLFVP